MTISKTTFYQSLYLEHCEELADFYATRNDSLSNPELFWLDHAYDEQIAEAHLDALVIGGELALATVIKQCEEGNAEDLFVATVLFCRLDQLRPFFAWFTKLDLTDQEVTNAIRAGLLWECPNHWIQALHNYPFAEHPQLLTLFLPVYAKVQQAIPPALASLLQEQKNGDPLIHLRTLASSNGNTASHAWTYLTDEADPSNEVDLEQQAIVTLSKLGDMQIQNMGTIWLKSHPHRLPALMLGAPITLAQHILSIPMPEWSPALVEALGIAGLPETVPYLVGALSQPELAQAAALALFHLTGAWLTEERFVEEQWEEDELFGDEREAFLNGTPPQHLDGRPYGEVIEALSINPDHWQQWWNKNQSQFITGQRNRLGQPYNAKALVMGLYNPCGSLAFRQACFDELVIRFRAPISFSPYDKIRQQQLAIQNLAQWAAHLPSHTTQQAGA